MNGLCEEIISEQVHEYLLAHGVGWCGQIDTKHLGHRGYEAVAAQMAEYGSLPYSDLVLRGYAGVYQKEWYHSLRSRGLVEAIVRLTYMGAAMLEDECSPWTWRVMSDSFEEVARAMDHAWAAGLEGGDLVDLMWSHMPHAYKSGGIISILRETGVWKEWDLRWATSSDSGEVESAQDALQSCVRLAWADQDVQTSLARYFLTVDKSKYPGLIDAAGKASVLAETVWDYCNNRLGGDRSSLHKLQLGCLAANGLVAKKNVRLLLVEQRQAEQVRPEDIIGALAMALELDELRAIRLLPVMLWAYRNPEAWGRERVARFPDYTNFVPGVGYEMVERAYTIRQALTRRAEVADGVADGLAEFAAENGWPKALRLSWTKVQEMAESVIPLTERDDQLPIWKGPLPSGLMQLCTTESLVEEGREMNHCVGAYTEMCRHSGVYIFRYYRERVRATVEIKFYGGKYYLAQMRGRGNSEVPEEGHKAYVRAWVEGG